MESKPPPHSVEAEMSVLGAVFVENVCMSKVSGMVDGQDFYREGHRKIYHSMLVLHRQRQPIDLVSMVQRLKDDGILEEVGGAVYLATLIDYVPTAANVGHYCRIVKEKSVVRQVTAFAAELMSKAGEGSAAELLTEAKSKLQEIAGGLDSLDGVSVKDILTFKQRRQRYEKYIREIDAARFKTGFPILDACIRGIAPGEVMTIIAYSGTFKTALLQYLLLGGAERSGFFSLFCSLEMPVEKLFERECQMNGAVSGREVEDHFAGRRGSPGVKEGLDRAASDGLLVCDRPRLTLEKISRYVEIARQKYGRIGVVGIDYLGLMHGPGKTLFEKTAHLSIETKNLAKELGVPIALLCQINRTGATSGGEIEMHHAKGGGDIEAGADFMLGLWKDREDQLICKVLKNRNGSAGQNFLVEMDRQSLTFQGMTPYKPPTVAQGGGKGIPF
jgi:replicative DNA helicase